MISGHSDKDVYLSLQISRKWLGIAAVVLAVLLAALLWHLRQPTGVKDVQGNAAPHNSEPRAERFIKDVVAIPEHATFAGFLASQHFSRELANKIFAASRPVYNLAHVRAGNLCTLWRNSKGRYEKLVYQIDSNHLLRVKRQGGNWQAAVVPIPYEVKLERVTGKVQDSLFGAVESAGEQPELAVKLAHIFGWQLDFYTDPRPGDTFEVLVQKKYLQGKLAGYGRVLAAAYNNHGQLYQAIRFNDGDGDRGYYTADGHPMKRAFLRSPLRFAAPVTSGFSLHRYHPILKIYRAHLGVDYGAPYGSPVQALGDGQVIFAGWSGESGNLVRIRHFNGYVTSYLHLSRILVHRGEHVKQGELIGRVGATGMATGPHLDFRIQHHGTYENFEALRRRLPPAAPVPHREWAKFVAVKNQLLPEMDGQVRIASANVPMAAAK